MHGKSLDLHELSATIGNPHDVLSKATIHSQAVLKNCILNDLLI